MATKLVNKRLIEIGSEEDKDRKENLSLDKIFVSFKIAPDGKTETREMKVCDLYIEVKKSGKTEIRKVKSFSEFQEEYKKGNVFIEETATQKLPAQGEFGNTEDVKPYYESFDIPESYESTHAKVNTNDIPYGLLRSRKLVESEPTNEDNYIMVYLDGSSKPEFYKKSEIYYLEGSTIKKLSKKGQKVDFSKLQNEALYVGNKIVSQIYTEKEFTFGECGKFESVNAENRLKNTYTLIENPTDEQKAEAEKSDSDFVKFEDKIYKKSSSEKYDEYYAAHTPVTLTVPDPKKPGKTKEEAYYAVKVYSVNQSGNYVQLRIKGAYKADMIEIKDLFDENGKEISKDKIKDYVGKSIKVKSSDGTMLETEPLTYEQAVYFYEKRKTYEQSMSNNDILAENAHLQTADGNFVQEKMVEPISYKFVKAGEDFDAYLIRAQEGETVKEYVVKKNEFEKYAGKLNVVGKFKLKESTFEKADIVQTTSTGKGLQECSVLKKFNNGKYDGELTKEEKKALKTKLNEDFINKYANGEYMVDYVWKDGEKVMLDPRGKRYVYSDTHYMRDYAADSVRYGYAGLRDSTVTYESENGKPGKFKGNAKVSFGKTCKKWYGIWAKSLLYYIGISMTGAGMLAALAAPWLVVGAAGALIAAPVLIPIITGITCFVRNVLHRPFKDKTKINREKWKTEVEDELKAINEDMKGSKISKGLKKEVFLARIEQLKSSILASSKSTVGTGLKVVDGKVQVTGENVNAVKKFKKECEKELKLLKKEEEKAKKASESAKKLGKKFEKLKAKGVEIDENNSDYQKYLKAQEEAGRSQETYNNHKLAFDNKIASYNGEAATYSADTKQEKQLQCLERLKNFWLIKKFATTEELKEMGLTAEINTISYDPIKNEFTVGKKKYNADEFLTGKLKKGDNELGKKLSTAMENVAAKENEKEEPKLEETPTETPIVEAVDETPAEELPVETPVVTEQNPENPPVEERPKQKRRKRKGDLYNITRSSESKVVSELEDQNSLVYDYIKTLLKSKKKGKGLTDKKAAEVIFKLTEKINKIHTDGFCAEDLLEDDSTEMFILKQATSKVSSLTTPQGVVND